MSSIDLPEVGDLHGVGARDLEDLLRRVDTVRRQAEALAAEIIGEADRSGAFREDGHRSVFAWARAGCNWSAGTTKLAVQTARVLQACDPVRQAATDASLGVDQLRVLAGLYANPRARDHFADSAELLVDDARGLWFDDLVVVAHRWEALADQDGAHLAHERAYAQRDAHLSIVGNEMHLAAHGGVPAGAEMAEIFERFREAEFAADWEAGLDQHGEQMCAALLQRSNRQLRSMPSCRSSAPRPPPASSAGSIRPSTSWSIWTPSSTTSTRPTASPSNHWTRPASTSGDAKPTAVTNSTPAMSSPLPWSVTFAGSCSTAPAWSSTSVAGGGCSPEPGATLCCWGIGGVCGPAAIFAPGAAKPITANPGTMVDQPGPPTGAPACPTHNRFKQRGYKTWRDPTGQWHVVRPDGTELGYLGNQRGPRRAARVL